MTFSNLGLSPKLLATVAREGYTEATPVQAAAIPFVLAGRDVLAAAQTGTGKTAAFTLPILERLAKHASSSPSPARHPIRALVLTPTRELAMQIDQSVTSLGAGTNLRSTVVYGGVPQGPQVKALWGGVEILVATPGRLFDLIGQKAVNLGQVEILVLDEADRMLDMGFIDDVRKAVALLPKGRQTLLFSATFSDAIRKLAREFQTDPEIIQVAARNATADNLTQVLYPVDVDRKADLLIHLVRRDGIEQVLVFTRTKIGASRLASYLDRRGVPAIAIHSDRTQGERTRALASFKAGEVVALVATDVASRGLDIDSLPHVVNFDLPFEAQDYIHRIGRTGRAGLSGTAISLVAPEEVQALRSIQRLLKRAIPCEVVEQFLPQGASAA
ncbi:MAG TPA: DEAD/DEAH box helicase [Candidatus Limnocylindrales bacterium]|nr:DEAD/DEAH box helicase [Candidatus Limnocylindrales bacterium]